MSATERVTALLADRVPLTLLFDIAGFAPTSQELLRDERYDDADVADSLAALARRVDEAVPHARTAWTA